VWRCLGGWRQVHFTTCIPEQKRVPPHCRPGRIHAGHRQSQRSFLGSVGPGRYISQDSSWQRRQVQLPCLNHDTDVHKRLLPRWTTIWLVSVLLCESPVFGMQLFLVPYFSRQRLSLALAARFCWARKGRGDHQLGRNIGNAGRLNSLGSALILDVQAAEAYPASGWICSTRSSTVVSEIPFSRSIRTGLPSKHATQHWRAA
jgi:hypothetical protein